MCMVNSGSHYGKFSEDQRARVKDLAPRILSALACIPVDVTKPFTICDYGCADGLTYLSLMEKCIYYLRQQHGEGLDIHIIYNDLPSNDFESTIKNVKVLESRFKNVIITTRGKSFYDQCNPEGSVNLAFCFASIHWISKCPTNLGEEIMHLHAEPKHQQVWQEQAAVDWQQFLINRRKELCPGGRLILDNILGIGPNGKWPMIAVYVHLGHLWREMNQEQTITKVELDQTVFRHYARTEEEIMKPFTDRKSPLYESDFELLNIDSQLVQYTFQELLNKVPDSEQTRRSVAHEWAMNIRQWADHPFTNALLPSRAEEDRKRIVDELYSRLERVLFNGIDYPGHLHTYLEISKNK